MPCLSCQVIALCAAPFLLDDPNVSLLFPPDAIERARKLLASFGTGGVGGYTDSRGNILVRSEVADFIQNRDGHRPETEVGTPGHATCSFNCCTDTDPFRMLLMPAGHS